ncbi:hypothetical protein A7A76_07355 [Lysobacter enzymogenes]|uniref:hypothetical protein n=1 Tax=Lysobacter enzymogenes TaxID=69 RepID=UPI0019D1ADDA|nr:hypothetical protein [Lysobacter enzymogenes]MBN7138919.1 hypothetical protein [Lysobacter enzymogenes]
MGDEAAGDDPRPLWLLAGFLAAPLAPAFVLAARSPGLGVESGDMASWLAVAALLYLPSFVAVALVGGFALAAAHRLKRVRWWSGLLAGSVAAALLSCLFAGFRGLDARWFIADSTGTLVWAACGAAAGLIVWLGWRLSGIEKR